MKDTLRDSTSSASSTMLNSRCIKKIELHIINLLALNKKCQIYMTFIVRNHSVHCEQQLTLWNDTRVFWSSRVDSR